MTIWMSSDTHFFHKNIINYSNRPFKSVDHMNWSIVQNFNAAVRPKDTLILTGDVSLGPISESLPFISNLNGYKILVPGNHDRVFSGESDAKRERFWPEYLKVFDEIWPEQTTTKIGGHWVAMSHFPYQGDHTENDRWVEKRPVDNGLPLIHGHIHELRKIDGRMFNVGVDVNGYFPVSQYEIAAWIESLESE